jgi:formylmethanofuran dehydrogenase subunit E
MNQLPEELQKAKAFHSHLGPYLVVGLKMGRAVVERMGDKPFSMAIDVFTGARPPLSCVVDGLQLATPCTVGNGQIRVREGNRVAIRVRRGQQQIELSLKPEVWERIRAAEGTDRLESLAVDLWSMKEHELLDVNSDVRLETRD